MMVRAPTRLAPSLQRMQIVLVRHGEPEWVRDGLSVDNPPLTERGLRQARHMSEALRDGRFDEVHVSPLIRARETAAPLYAALGRTEQVSHWLEEIRNPVWHGSPSDKAELAFREERARPSHLRWEGLEGGEAVRDFVARIREGCGLFLAERGVERLPGDLPLWHIENPDQTIVLVAHAGTNSCIISLLLGLDPVPWEWDRFVLGHASVTRIDSYAMGDGHTFGLSRLSDVEHLAADDRTF